MIPSRFPRTVAAPHSLLVTTLLLLLCLTSVASAASDKKSKPLEPCTVRSPSSNAFFDLNQIAKRPATDKDLEKHKDDAEPYEAKSWHARGYDYNANFTLNFCAPVVEGLRDVEGVDERLWTNVTGYYEKGGRTYSIGTLNTEPVFRGRKLVLNYTEGSPCPGSSPSFLDRSHDGVRRKSSILSLHCEKDPLAPKAHISFVGSMDECTYFFEVRTLAACAGVESANESLSPGGVFGVIALIAVLVYIVGGCVYQRHVLNQRGWRQLPNYALWAGIGSALKDCLIILTSSCSRFFPSRRSYSRVAVNGYGRGRNGQSDAENRLIDQLDEEWDD
ncbi:mannose 6-phosphate receptor domain-containing protein [Rhizodiscina lignyota]|uniref:Mannose 6-phosphate receptor domain-containing protein n=1 Tax=Rhizodiscina lignyota TaxID=1504668 RepID=A0A9P4IGY3_9PEZI|nr:mannose 6-phosphate receptor domain-containing protein [Rhizodiscina lignyota]